MRIRKNRVRLSFDENSGFQIIAKKSKVSQNKIALNFSAKFIKYQK